MVAQFQSQLVNGIIITTGCGGSLARKKLPSHHNCHCVLWTDEGEKKIKLIGYTISLVTKGDCRQRKVSFGSLMHWGSFMICDLGELAKIDNLMNSAKCQDISVWFPGGLVANMLVRSGKPNPDAGGSHDQYWSQAQKMGRVGSARVSGINLCLNQNIRCGDPKREQPEEEDHDFQTCP